MLSLLNVLKSFVAAAAILFFCGSFSHAFDNSCGVNYFSGWCKEREKETPSDIKKAESDPYVWQPKYANEPPPPLADVFRDPSPENIALYKEWYRKRMERVDEVGLIMTGRDAQSQQGAVNGVKPAMFNKAIYFFSESCPACVRMTPLLSEYQQSGKLVGIGIKSTDRSAAAYLQRNGVNIPSGGDDSGDIARNYNVTSTPTLVLLSDEGDVMGRYEGSLDRTALSRLFGNAQ